MLNIKTLVFIVNKNVECALPFFVNQDSGIKASLLSPVDDLPTGPPFPEVIAEEKVPVSDG